MDNGMEREELAFLAEKATSALADIAMMLAKPSCYRQARHKAQRIHDEIRAVWLGPGPDDWAPDDWMKAWLAANQRKEK